MKRIVDRENVGEFTVTLYEKANNYYTVEVMLGSSVRMREVNLVGPKSGNAAFRSAMSRARTGEFYQK